ncbi:MAG TPA: phosphatase PAP2 family protein [Telluria sp.]|nr:phosphatase PAP2 family protein [Telluria sp.]
MLEQLNLELFSTINAHPGLASWQLSASLFAAEWLILLVPLGLCVMWISGVQTEREAAVRALLATGLALAINAVIGLLWYHPRPFVLGVGHTFMHHAADSSFPSDHATIMFTMAVVLAASRAEGGRRFGQWLLPLAAATAWARVYLGVHYPMDMLGALVVAGVVAALANTRAVAVLCQAVQRPMEMVYRRVLAAPIARGWLRP